MDDCDEDDMTNGWCPMCDADNLPMGRFGNRLHYRCMACGIEWSAKVDPGPDPDAQRDDRLDAAQQQQYEQDHYD